jgi:oligoribonuclease NrnB/cAMP/cGMP phosphodiesterase (DHH superfamily)
MKELFYDDLKRNIKGVRKILNDDNTILLITHANCMDGMGCQLLMEKIFSNVIVMKSSPQKVNDLIDHLDASKFDAIVLADISTTNEEFLAQDHVMLVDHHDTAQDLHDPDNLIFVYNFECGTKLLKRTVEAALKQPLKKYNELIDLINDYDLWEHTDERSKKLAKTFYKRTSDDEFATRFWNFKVSFTQEEEDQFEQDQQEYERVYNQLEIFELDRTLTGFAIYGTYNNDLCHDIMERNGLHVAVLFNPQTRCASIRTIDEEIHLGEMMKEYGTGGGHPMAAGFKAVTDNDLKDTLDFVDKYIYKNYPHLRK